MLIIADSGSTKTTWSLVQSANNAETVVTSGINPMYQDEETILILLQKEFQGRPEVPSDIYFYGAGCINNGVNKTVSSALSRFFNCASPHVDTDLKAAARALCRHEPGIACIIGTGSNSCYYDGRDIVKNVSPLGFMLGDEGSGAVIGKKFIADLLKNQLPVSIQERFFSTYDLKPHEIMENVYKKPFPNRFLAQFTRFIHHNIEEASLKQLVKSSFIEFFKRNVSQYPEARTMPIHFTGSVAYYFEALLREAAGEMDYQTGKIIQSPSEDLVQYHINNTTS